jgi:hypothetical protein
MKVSDMFPRKYATGADLQGRAVTVTIDHVKAERMRPIPGQPEAEKWVLYTQEGKKGIVLNRTLAGQIARALGSDETEEWTGKRITLYPESVSVAGTARLAIRARAAAEDKAGTT